MSRALLLVASERPRYADAKGFAGAHGRLLDRMLQHAGYSRDDVSVIFPEQWQPGMENDYGCVVLAGEYAVAEALWPAPPDKWHGSVLPANAARPTSYDAYRSWLREPAKYVITYDVTKLHAMWEWHPLAAIDWQRAGRVARGEHTAPDPDKREWVINEPWRLSDVLREPVMAFDTELSPVWMFGCATATQVHIMDWSHWAAVHAGPLLRSKTLIKVAHNLQHDLAMCELRFGIPVSTPYFDTYGGAHLLNTALERTLSPGIASRFTSWPHHKWLSDVDAIKYNGLDNIVCYDAYHEIVRQLRARGLWEVAQHDHRLLQALFAMQMTGFKVDAGARAAYEAATAVELTAADAKCSELAAPVIAARVTAFEKPHLFREQRKCPCCGGGKTQAAHCWRCGGLPAKPSKRIDYFAGPKPPQVGDCEKVTVSVLRTALPTCRVCNGGAKITVSLPFNPGSNDQVADVLYRGLRFPPRRFKGKETVAAAQLKPLQERHPLIKALVQASVLRADLKTVERLTPGTDGRLHCVFDPWGTESGRVASREGLLEPGTNAMNIPKKARRFVVPDDGCVLLYPDFSQIEARAVAVLSGDPGLLRAFTEPVNWPGHERHGTIDSHTIVQQMVSQYVVITRDQAKRVTYAVMYGAGAKQLAVELTAEAMRKGGGTVTEQHAAAIIEAFFKAFPKVRVWQQAIETELLRTRTLRAPSGRERHWPGRIVDVNTGRVLNEVIKQAWSYKPQEMGAHIMALGVMEIHEKHRKLLTPLIHVHDAVAFQCKIAEQSEATHTAMQVLSRQYLGMDFPSAMKAGANWYEAS